MSYFDEVRKRMDEREWFTCPSCLKEWSGLFTIRFLDDNGARHELEICGECKSFVPGISYAKNFLPLPGATLVHRQMSSLGDRYSIAGVVDYGDLTVTVLAIVGGFSFRLKNDPEKKEHRADDAFQAWIKIRRILMETPTTLIPADKGTKSLGAFNYE